MRHLIILLHLWLYFGLVFCADERQPIPEGLAFDRWDHLQSASEPLEFVCRLPSGTEMGPGQMRFRVFDSNGTEVAAGNSDTGVKIGDRLFMTLLPAERMSDWVAGWYDLQVAVTPGEGAWNSFRFHRIGRAGAKQVVYLSDNPSPEEYAEWLNGDRREMVEPLKSMPVSSTPGLVVVSHWSPPAAGTIDSLRAYAEGGGTVLIFGEADAAFDAITPLLPQRPEPARTVPVKLMSAEEHAGADLADRSGCAVEAVLAMASSGTTVLQRCVDGMPFLAERRVGLGRIIACAGPLKPGPVYDRLLGGLLGLPAHIPASRVASSDGFAPGISVGNVGRFGWTNADRTDAVGLRADGSWRMWDVPEDTFRIEFAADTTAPTTLACVEANWVAKHLVARGGIYGRRSDIRYGLGMPGAMYANQEASSFDLRFGSLGALLLPCAGGAVVRRPDPGEEVPLGGLDRGWLLVCTGSRSNGSFWPMLVTVNRRIVGIRRTERDRLSITCNTTGLEVTLMPLVGIEHPAGAGAGAGVGDGKILALAQRADWWSSALRRRIINCREDYRLVDANRIVEIRNTYETIESGDAYGRPAMTIAPLPPLLPLLAEQGLAELPKAAIDTGFATFCGPLWAVPGVTETVYRLPLPDLSYPLANTPIRIPEGDAQAKALLKRICEHATLPRNIYLPVGYGVVDRQPGRLSPTRDLDWLTTAKPSQEVRSGPYIDLHRNLAGTWGCLLLRPYIDAQPGHEDAKAMLEAKIARNMVRDIGFFQYKSVVRYRMEPNGGGRYPVIFMGPVRFDQGHRIFHDLNETASIVAYAFDAWLETGGNEDFIRCNLPFLEGVTSFLRRCNDWSWMSSMAVEWGMGNNIDMLNSELPCWSAMHRLCVRIGDVNGAGLAAYMAAKASASVTARFFMRDFYNRIGFPDLLQVAAVSHEMARMSQISVKADSYLPFGLANGYGEGWPSLWPNELNAGYIEHNLIGIDVYNHSKGVCGELPRAYRHEPLLRVLSGYERAFRAACKSFGKPILYSRIAGFALAGGDSIAAVRADIEAVMRHPQATARALGAGTADWEVSSMVLLLDLLIRGE